MEHESNIQKLDFAVLVPQAQRGDSRAVNSLLLGFTPMVRAFKYNSYYVHYLEQDDTEILALMAVNDAIKSFKQHNFHFFATHVKYTIRRQLNIQVQKKKNLFDAELATLDEEGCTSLDALSSECYKESISRDERSACVLELVARRRTQEHRADCHEPDLFDLVNSKRRVRELIEHLEKKFTLAAGQ